MSRGAHTKHNKRITNLDTLLWSRDLVVTLSNRCLCDAEVMPEWLSWRILTVLMHRRANELSNESSIV